VLSSRNRWSSNPLGSDCLSLCSNKCRIFWRRAWHTTSRFGSYVCPSLFAPVGKC